MNTMKTQTEIEWVVDNKAIFKSQHLDYLHITTLSIFSLKVMNSEQTSVAELTNAQKVTYTCSVNCAQDLL
jgi:hypothetical protein